MMRMEASSRLKLAELSSSAGAGILGIGLGALVAAFLRGFAIAMVLR
jgi:hypothetical protein